MHVLRAQVSCWGGAEATQPARGSRLGPECQCRAHNWSACEQGRARPNFHPCLTCNLPQARKKVAEKGWKNVTVVEADACQWAPPEGCATLVTFSYSLSSESVWFCSHSTVARVHGDSWAAGIHIVATPAHVLLLAAAARMPPAATCMPPACHPCHRARLPQ